MWLPPPPPNHLHGSRRPMYANKRAGYSLFSWQNRCTIQSSPAANPPYSLLNGLSKRIFALGGSVSHAHFACEQIDLCFASSKIYLFLQQLKLFAHKTGQAYMASRFRILSWEKSILNFREL